MNNQKTPSVPEPIARYLESANRFDADGATGNFTPDAIVRDEQKEYVGRGEIAQWITQTSQASQPHVTVTSITSLDAKVKMVGCVTGNFPGSPVNLDYDFHLRDGMIAQLTIG